MRPLFTKITVLVMLATTTTPSYAASSPPQHQSSNDNNNNIRKEDSKMWAAYESCEEAARPHDGCVEKDETEEICNNDTNPNLPRCNVLTTCTWSCPGRIKAKDNTKDARDGRDGNVSCGDFDIMNCDDCGEYCDTILDPPYGARCNGRSGGRGLGSCRCSAGPKGERTSVFFCKEKTEELGETSMLRKFALAGTI